jgi:CRP-like cAMP-binding protein
MPSETEQPDVFILRDVPGDGRDALLSCLKPSAWKPGETIIEQGGEGQDLFIVSSGYVDVLVKGGGDREQAIATLGPGDCFGEMSLIGKTRRCATVRASEACTALSLGRADIDRLATSHPAAFHQLVLNLARELARRIRLLDEALVSPETFARWAAIRPSVRVVTKSARAAPGIASDAGGDLGTLRSAPVFHGVGDEALRVLYVAAEETTVTPGSVIVREGDFGDRLFVLASGSVGVVKGLKGRTPTVLAVLPEHSIFGEMCVVGELVRSASIRALESCRVFSLTGGALAKFGRFWPKDHTVLLTNIARELSSRLQSLDKVFAARAF